MHKQKGLAPLVIIILIALAVGGYLLYQKQLKPALVPQSSPIPTISDASPAPTGAGETANWKTYTKDEWKIEFKYPKEAQILENTKTSLIISINKRSDGIRIFLDSDEQYIKSDLLKTCDIVYKELDKNPNKDRPACLEKGDKFNQAKDIDTVRINNTDLRSFYMSSTGQGGTWHVLQTIEQPFIQLIPFYSDETFFNQILSTFKFNQ